MVVLNKIYTRTGDAGTTALGSGERVPKHALRIAAYGTIDETNAAIGMARVHLGNALPGLDGKLIRMQNDLFDLGADLCVPDGDGRKGKQNPLRVSDAQVQRLEDEIDEMNTELQPLRSFVLPGGSPASAALHVARTVCRRAERLMVELDSREKLNPDALRYMNRLSDFFFVAARVANDRGGSDVLWVPGENR